MAVYRNTSGELEITPRPTTCRVCGMPTDQPPVCYDLRCEVEYQRRLDNQEGE